MEEYLRKSLYIELWVKFLLVSNEPHDRWNCLFIEHHVLLLYTEQILLKIITVKQQIPGMSSKYRTARDVYGTVYDNYIIIMHAKSV